MSYVLLLNDDTQVMPGAIERMVAVRGEQPFSLAEPEKAVVARMIVDIADQHVEDDPPKERVGLRLHEPLDPKYGWRREGGGN